MRGVRIRLAQARQEPAARPLDSRYQELRCRRNTVASTNWSAELLRTCPPDEIQLICRWLNPASLRAYARLGTSTFMSWVDAAEKAVADSVQTSSLPNLLSCTLNLAGRSAHMLRPSSTRRLMTRRRQLAPGPAPAAPPPADLRPLTMDNCLQRLVLVPHAYWPTYGCDEHRRRAWLDGSRCRRLAARECCARRVCPCCRRTWLMLPHRTLWPMRAPRRGGAAVTNRHGPYHSCPYLSILPAHPVPEPSRGIRGFSRPGSEGEARAAIPGVRRAARTRGPET